MKTIVLLLACCSILASLPAAAPPVRAGEQFAFRVSWGLFAHAGDITITADRQEVGDTPYTRVVTETSTRGLIRALYPFDGRVESLFNPQDGRLIAAFAETHTRRRQTRVRIEFDYTDGVARYVDELRPERTTTLALPEGRPMDLITSLIETRFWDIRPGDRRPVVVLFDDEFYDLTIWAEEVERVSTAQGRAPALKLVPRMEENPKGMFRRGGSVRVWLAQDDARLPLRLEVSVKVGTATAVLTGYRPPPAAGAATGPVAVLDQPSPEQVSAVPDAAAPARNRADEIPHRTRRGPRRFPRHGAGPADAACRVAGGGTGAPGQPSRRRARVR